MRLFLYRLFVFSSGFIFLFSLAVLGYIYYDPFRILYHYSDYSFSHVPLNRDYVSTETYINKQARYHYNSFVFGSSRTLAFKPASWKKHLPAGARPFMFDASLETVYGIATKLKYLDQHHAAIDNVLIVLCRDASFVAPDSYSGHLYGKHPATSGESRLAFQKRFFEAYLDPRFLFRFYAFTFTGTNRKWMYGFIEPWCITMDSITNELNILEQEEEITRDPIKYYLARGGTFYEQKGERTDSAARINAANLAFLKDIRRILEKHHTNYRVVISPLYEQIKLHPTDRALLQHLFGPHVYDFSGKNRFTDRQTNYYETSHYRPVVGDSILRILYNAPSVNPEVRLTNR